MMQDREITIIGAGSTGLSIAYFLSKMGEENVRILEKGYVGSGSTGRCGTGIRAQFSDKPTIRMMKKSQEIWNRWSNKMDFEYNQTGYLYLLHNKEEVEHYENMQKIQNSLGVPSRMINPEEIRDLCEYVDISDVVAGSYNPEDGKAHPFKVVLELKKYLESTDIDIKEWTKVQNINLDNEGQLKTIKTSKGNYDSNILINAAGGWAPKIGDMMDIEIPIEPYRHQAAITEPFKKGSIEPMIISMKNKGAYLTQTGRGGIIGGVETPEDEAPTYSVSETLDFGRRWSEAFSRIIPALKHTRILRQWAGYYAMSPDHNPMLGEYKVDGHYLAAGFSGHGYMMAPAVGKSMVELILEGESELSLDYYDPSRVDRGELREEALQMG